jgi:hypothetical protein
MQLAWDVFVYSLNIKSKMAVFWVVAPCSVVEIYRRFRVLAVSVVRVMILALPTGLHGAVSHKTVVFVPIPVRTLYLARWGGNGLSSLVVCLNVSEPVCAM